MTSGNKGAGLQGRLRAGLDQMGMALSCDQGERMVAFLRLLHRWNGAYNLTAVRDPREMVAKHLLDSLSVLPFLSGNSVLDIGTGPGLPGIPLAIASPARVFHLLDSNGKKIRFLRQAVTDLGLGNINVIQARMESYLPAEKFATIISRAVASVPDLLVGVRHLLAHPARLLVMKGRRPAPADLRGLEPTPDMLKIYRLEVPFVGGERHLVEVSYD